MGGEEKKIPVRDGNRIPGRPVLSLFTTVTGLAGCSQAVDKESLNKPTITLSFRLAWVWVASCHYLENKQ